MISFRGLGLPTFRGVPVQLTLAQLLGTLAIIAASSLLAFLAHPWKGEVTGALIFVLGITVAGAICGLASALVAAFCAFFLYNFYFAEPVLTFRLGTGADLAPLIVFNACAVVTGVLAGRLRDREEAARRSNLQLGSLLAASEALQTVMNREDIAAVLARTTPIGDSGMLGLFLLVNGQLEPFSSGPARDDWQAAAEEAFWSVSSRVQSGELMAHRLEGSTGSVGVLVLQSDGSNMQDADFVRGFANVVALAVERAQLFELITESKAAERTEELKSALLASVSHDLRTPLTAISASASSLLEYGEALGRETTHHLLRGIVEESERLNRYTANLLELSRLEAGLVETQAQILGVAEIVDSALRRVRSRVGERRIIRRLDNGDALVRADAALFELALVNVLENAISYSEDGTRVAVMSAMEGEFCKIDVEDEGCGIANEDLSRVFDRFFRARRTQRTSQGSGLGLAIAKGFVEALGGNIEASTPGLEGQGTRITIRLPLVTAELAS